MSDSAASKPKAREIRIYSVNRHRTIFVPDVPVPKVNSEVFSCVSSYGIESFTDLINQISSCTPLSSYFGQLANEKAVSLQDQLEEDLDLTTKQEEAMRALIIELESEPEDETSWRAWISAAKSDRLSEFISHINDWLKSPINWDEWEFFDQTWSGQDVARNFFRSESVEVCDALQIRISEGDHPGSSYCAAELRLDIETANNIAERLKLKYRFKAADS